MIVMMAVKIKLFIDQSMERRKSHGCCLIVWHFFLFFYGFSLSTIAHIHTHRHTHINFGQVFYLLDQTWICFMDDSLVVLFEFVSLRVLMF